MKTEPTDIDREAARRFVPTPGMRVLATGEEWARLAMAEWAGSVLAHWENHGQAERNHITVFALDTDDPATVGCMLAQVEQAEGIGISVTIVDRLVTTPGDPDRRFAVLVSNMDGIQDVFTGPTRGAALVAAMRAFKGAK